MQEGSEDANDVKSFKEPMPVYAKEEEEQPIANIMMNWALQSLLLSNDIVIVVPSWAVTTMQNALVGEVNSGALISASLAIHYLFLNNIMSPTMQRGGRHEYVLLLLS